MASRVWVGKLPLGHSCPVGVKLVCSAVVVADELRVLGKPTKPLSSITPVPYGPEINCLIGVTALGVISISTIEFNLHHLHVILVWLRVGYWAVEYSHTQVTDAIFLDIFSGGLDAHDLAAGEGLRTEPMP